MKYAAEMIGLFAIFTFIDMAACRRAESASLLRKFNAAKCASFTSIALPAQSRMAIAGSILEQLRKLRNL
jgi:hypothetical protein